MFKLKLFLAVSVLGLAVAAAPARACHEQVCGDNLRFCQAGCTSTSPSSCRSNCLSDYNGCTKCDGPLPDEGGQVAVWSAPAPACPAAPADESFLKSLK